MLKCDQEFVACTGHYNLTVVDVPTKQYSHWDSLGQFTGDALDMADIEFFGYQRVDVENVPIQIGLTCAHHTALFTEFACQLNQKRGDSNAKLFTHSFPPQTEAMQTQQVRRIAGAFGKFAAIRIAAGFQSSSVHGQLNINRSLSTNCLSLYAEHIFYFNYTWYMWGNIA